MSKKIGSEWNGNELILPLFSRPFYISKQKILNYQKKRATHSEVVILSKYITGYPGEEIKGKGRWLHYRDFKDAIPLLEAFCNNVEKRLAEHFKGKIKELIDCCNSLGGMTYEEDWNYDVSFLFNALPNIPVLLLYNDSDELFPAQCNILFKSTIKYYLDMESVAILGLILTDYLLSQLKSLQ